ncbi:MAG: hypothetical protein IJF74_03150 [Clostridia bacterium]|nr:hypothetical protein [Clostridia bacterium]
MLKKLFETVNERCGVTKREFARYFNASVSLLRSKYGDSYVTDEGKELFPIADENSELPVYDIYLDGIGDNIEFLKTGNEASRVDFLAKSEYAYRTVWRGRVKDLRVKGDRW